MNNTLFISTAFITGSLIPLQLVFNAQLGAITKSPYSATLIVFVIGLLAMALLLDHLGAFGNPQVSLNLWRVAGVLMMLGAFLRLRRISEYGVTVNPVNLFFTISL